MLGHAMDFYVPGVRLEELRVIGLRLQRGGVGFYPTSGSPFVHMDTGGVRMWPRMARDELLHVFPDGRTAYIPSDGHPLPGYELAVADLRSTAQDPAATWMQEARDAGIDENIVLASDTGGKTIAPPHPPAQERSRDKGADDTRSRNGAPERRTPHAEAPQAAP